MPRNEWYTLLRNRWGTILRNSHYWGKYKKIPLNVSILGWLYLIHLKRPYLDDLKLLRVCRYGYNLFLTQMCSGDQKALELLKKDYKGVEVS